MEYLSDGFLEKNRDTVYEEQMNILKASKVKDVRGGEPERDRPQQDPAGLGVGGGGPTPERRGSRDARQGEREGARRLFPSEHS